MSLELQRLRTMRNGREMLVTRPLSVDNDPTAIHVVAEK